jgi:HEPN domain-containing protein
LLLKEVKKFTDIPDIIKEAVTLTTYAVQTRYPDEYDDITKEEYERSLEIAKDCLDWVESKIGENINKNGT